jgi:hypothetical protein
MSATQCAPASRGGVLAIGVAAVHGLGKGQRRHGGGAGVGLLDGGDQRSRSRCQMASGQPARPAGARPGPRRARSRSGSVSERSESSCGRAGAAAKRGAQVGPGLAQGVFVQRRLAALRASTPLDAIMRGGAGQAGLSAGSRRLPASKSICTSTIGMTGAFDQPDLGAAGLRPVLDGQQRPRRWLSKKRSSARQESAQLFFYSKNLIRIRASWHAPFSGGAGGGGAGRRGPVRRLRQQRGHGELVVAEILAATPAPAAAVTARSAPSAARRHPAAGPAPNRLPSSRAWFITESSLYTSLPPTGS